MKARVITASPEGERSRRYVLSAADAGCLPNFAAGAHVVLHFDLPGAGRQSRCYSLINPPASSADAPETYEIVIQREAAGRGGSAWLTANLACDAVVDIDGPYQNFALEDGLERPLLVAGGIGVTPILSMARACDLRGRTYDLHFFARSPEDAPLLHAVRGLTHGRIHLHFGVLPSEVPTRLHDILAASACRNPLYVCGPQGLIATLLDTARSQGWKEEDLHLERFEPLERPTDRPFRVRLTRSGELIEVGAHQSMLQALSACGLPIASSCGAGICGSCLVTVVSGAVDHRDEFLTPEEKRASEMMCVCVSRALGDEIAIDL